MYTPEHENWTDRTRDCREKNEQAANSHIAILLHEDAFLSFFEQFHCIGHICYVGTSKHLKACLGPAFVTVLDRRMLTLALCS